MQSDHYPLQSEVSVQNTPGEMDLGKRHVNGYIGDAVVFMHVTWILY